MAKMTMSRCKRTGTCICTTEHSDLIGSDVDMTVEMRNTFLTAELNRVYKIDMEEVEAKALAAENYDLFD